MFRACGALPALGCPAQQPKPVALDPLRLPRLGSSKSKSLPARCGATLPSRSPSNFNPESDIPPTERLQFSGPGGSDGHNGGNSGGWSGGNGGGNGDGDGNDFFSGGLILFLAGIPFIIDTTRKWSFGKDGIRVLHLGAEAGMPKPIFAAMAIGSPAGPPAPPAESMSGGGTSGSFVGGVLAILILCAGGYYIFNKKKGGSGSPAQDDEELQMEPVGNVGTRSLDPALFQRPVATIQPESGTSEPEGGVSQPEAEPESAPASANPLVDHMEEKDKFFTNGSPSDGPEKMAVIPAPSSSPPETPAPPAAATPKQPTPDEIVKDQSSSQPQQVVPDFGAKTGNFFMADLSKKDDMFGRPAEPDMAPLKPTASATSSQKPVPSTSTQPVDHNDLLQQQIEKDKFFGAGDSRSEVEARPVLAPEGFGDVAVPEAPSPADKNVGESKNKPPVKVVKVYDSMPHEGVFIQDSGKASLLKEMEAKDSMFTEKPPNGAMAHEVEIPRQILDVVSGPIMTDIAKQLEATDDGKQMVGVGLDVAGDTVALKLNFLGEDTEAEKSTLEHVAAPSTPTVDPPSKAVPEDTIPTKPSLVDASPKGTAPEKIPEEGLGKQDGDGEHDEEGSASPHEETPAAPRKKKRVRRGKSKNKRGKGKSQGGDAAKQGQGEQS